MVKIINYMKVIEIKREDLPSEYIKATHIGVVVKYYTGEKFSTFDNIEFVASRIKWNKEERQRYEDAIDKIEDEKKALNSNYITRQERFQGGNNFEKEAKLKIEKNQINVDEIFNWNDRETCLYSEELKACATPDYIVKDYLYGHKIIEVKGSKSTTSNHQNYTYQLALQYLLLNEFDNNEYAEAILKYKDREIILTADELDEKARIIKESLKQFWEDYENGKFKLLSCDKAIEQYIEKNQKIQFLECEEEYMQMVQEIINYDNQKERIDNLKKTLFERYKNYTNVNIDDDGMLIKVSVIKPQKTLIDKQYILSELNEALKKYDSKKEELEKLLKEIDMNNPQEKIVRSGFLKIKNI